MHSTPRLSRAIGASALLLALCCAPAAQAGGKKRPFPLFEPVAPINPPSDVATRTWFTPELDVQLSRYTGEPITHGNDVKLLVTGAEFFPRRLELIAAAREAVDFQNYLWRDDESGLAVARALAAATQRGVRVRLIMDWTNAFPHEQSYRIMQNAGIEILVYNQAFWGLPEFNKRLHEKVMIVDGEVALQGGANMANEYLLGTPEMPLWQDLEFEMRGPLTAQMQRRYDANWNWMATMDYRARVRKQQQTGGAGTVTKKYTIYHEPTPTSNAPVGTSKALLQHQQPYRWEGQGDVYAQMMADLIDQARERLILYVPYLAPEPSFKEAILRAAKRGVDVSLVTNSAATNDMAFILVNAAYTHYGKLIRAGVKIYEREKSTLHAKAILVDRKALTVGSHNFTHRSFNENGEANAMTDDLQAIERFERMFAEDRASFRHVDEAEYRKLIRTLPQLSGLILGRWLEGLF
ncbi:MAG: phosphatidylserine/phosphatidylglycerophosphate/cardiolipin synthase family protein [Bdellovibrionales bacterium]|nr:phosphatidylserine/phosphatidylglycerophosphate/cardiolipin synthase family protein [Bdellovibrionales bacterium]